MAAENESGGPQAPPSSSVSKQGFFDAGVAAVESLAKAAGTHGIRNTAVAAGIVILLLLVVEFATPGDHVPEVAEVIGLVAGFALILGALIASSLEYKWDLQSKTEHLRIDADYEIARLSATNLEKEGRSSERPR